MILLSDKLSLGNSSDEENAHKITGVTAILNVAVDMPRVQDSEDIEYAHVGLIDGPGNVIAAYSAAVLTLSMLLKRHENSHVLVCCHDGYSRSLAVVLIYMILKAGRISSHPTFPNYWVSWDKAIEQVRIITGEDFAEPHSAHRDMFEKLPLGILEQLL